VLNAANVISGNIGDGVHIFNDDTVGNRVRGNLIGTDCTGAAALPNSANGVFIERSPGNYVGGSDDPVAGNVISGNGLSEDPNQKGYGIKIQGASATGNKVQGNYIGTNYEGDARISNAAGGVLVENASDNYIGGAGKGNYPELPPGNLIAGNNVVGIRVTGTSSGNVIESNMLGTDFLGSTALGGGNIRLEGANVTDTLVWSNLISGNAASGIYISGSKNTVAFNFIGTDLSGELALGNQLHGVEIERVAQEGGVSNVIASNVISANGYAGASGSGRGVLVNKAQGTRIEWNHIGTDFGGTRIVDTNGKSLGNRWDGVYTSVATDTTISNNLIGGNGRWGVYNSTSAGTSILDNRIGDYYDPTSKLPNQSGGIRPGGGETIRGNRVAGNLGPGIYADTGSNILIADNDLEANQGEGIRIGATVSDVTVQDNKISWNAASAVAITAASNITLSGNFIGTDETLSADMGNAGKGIVIDGGSTGITIAGNTIKFNDAEGVDVLSASGVTLTNNTVSKNDGDGIAMLAATDYTVTGNDVEQNGKNGFLMPTGTAVFTDNSALGNGVLDESAVDMLFSGGTAVLEGLYGEADKVLQTAGNIGVADTFSVHDLYKLQNGTFGGGTEATLNVQDFLQTGGQHIANHYVLNVLNNYEIDAGQTVLAGTGTLQVGGQMLIHGGDVSLTWNLTVAGGITIFSGGTLEILASSTIHGNITNSGILSIGALGATNALVLYGNFTQTGSGRLIMHVADDGSCDTLIIHGSATLAGTLQVSGSAGPPGYALITWNSYTGSFTLDLPPLSPPYFYDPEYSSSGFTLLIDMDGGG
jgi:parallel beta-helix repeat protein